MPDRRLDPDYLAHHIRDPADTDLPPLPTTVPSTLFADRDFFLSPRDQTVARLRPHRADTLAAAHRILDHDIQGWGDVSIQHPDTVDFNADYGRSGKYGFHYWNWSQPLLHATLLTDDPHYVLEFDRLFNQWYDQRNRVHGNIPTLDVIWYELGLALRTRFFAEAYSLDHPARSDATRARYRKTFLGAARWLFEEQSLGYRDGNWQIMGSYGLALLATRFPEFPESPQWLALALQRLRDHAARDFFPDGCHSERVPSSYSVVAHRDLRNVVTLLHDRPDAAAPFRAALDKSAGFFRAICPADDVLPGINDGERWPLPPLLRDDLRASPRVTTSSHLPASGFTTFRSDSAYMLLNYGPAVGGHTHNDSLSFELHAAGRPLAIDSGIGRTYDDPLHETWYRRSKAHNMLTVDDADLDRKSAAGTDVVWSASPDLEFFAATHHGYLASHGITHRRHVAFLRKQYWIVYDLVTLAAESHTLNWELHTPGPGLFVAIAEPGWSTAREKRRASVRGIPNQTATHADIDWLRFQKSAPAKSTTAIAVLLYPTDAPTPPKISFTGDAGRYIVTHLDSRDLVVFQPDGATLTSKG